MAEPTFQQTFNLALQHHQAGRLNEAWLLYQSVLAHHPDHIDSLQNLGLIAHQSGQHALAIDLIRRSIDLNPRNAIAFTNLATVLHDSGQIDQSIAAARQAISLSPNLPEAFSNLAQALNSCAQFDEAIVAARKAIALKPNYPEAHNNLVAALAGREKFDDAIAASRHALALRPIFPQALINLASALRARGDLDGAAAAYHQAISLNPSDSQAHNNLAITLADLGRFAEAIAAYKRALQLKPNYAEAHGNLLLALMYHSGDRPDFILAEHLAWARAHAYPLKNRIQKHTNDPSPTRPLRIGYVSADFRNHPVGHFLLPLLQNHDHENFQIYCYSNSTAADDLTLRLKLTATVWRQIPGRPNDEVASLIRSDAIDILVDLSAHTHGNRLLLFAQKAAPIQVTYLAYPGTTGLDTIDYRLTDPHLDPPRHLPEPYTEKSFHLPQSYWCYEPTIPSPQIAPPPSATLGFITFGCLNNPSKLNPTVLKLWSDILKSIPSSRLILHAVAGSRRDDILKTLTASGIDPARITFVGWLPAADYMHVYHQIDVALDPFPFAGGTTTCNALWMGVPVITLAGPSAIGRGGVSILTNVGLPDLIAEFPDAYIHIASCLAADSQRLTNIRSTIREKMRSSPLMNSKQFTADVENAYRQMWRTWCEAPK